MSKLKPELSKPEVKSKSYWDYHEVIDYIEKKYDIKTRDYARSDQHFPSYLKLFNQKSPSYPNAMDLKNGKITQEFYDAEYAKIHKQYNDYTLWCIDNPSPPYLDFWHWLAEQRDFSNGSIISIELDREVHDRYCPSWVVEILTLIKNEFVEEGSCTELEFWIEW